MSCHVVSVLLQYLYMEFIHVSYFILHQFVRKNSTDMYYSSRMLLNHSLLNYNITTIHVNVLLVCVNFTVRDKRDKQWLEPHVKPVFH